MCACAVCICVCACAVCKCTKPFFLAVSMSGLNDVTIPFKGLLVQGRLVVDDAASVGTWSVLDQDNTRLSSCTPPEVSCNTHMQACTSQYQSLVDSTSMYYCSRLTTRGAHTFHNRELYIPMLDNTMLFLHTLDELCS